jgi:hypothetical protein
LYKEKGSRAKRKINSSLGKHPQREAIFSIFHKQPFSLYLSLNENKDLVIVHTVLALSWGEDIRAALLAGRNGETTMHHPHYQHTQIGWMIIGCSLPGVFLFPLLLGFLELGWLGLLLTLLLLLILLLFGSLSVAVDQHQVLARFGLGLIRKRIVLSEVRAYGIVKNPWHYGWGIHGIPGGFIYNVSGPWALEFSLSNGTRCRLGTDQPEALHQAIARVKGESPPLSLAAAQKNPSLSAKGLLISLGIIGTLIAMGATLIYLQGGPPLIAVRSSGLSVKSLFYGGTFSWRDFRQVTLELSLPPIRLRTNGYAFGPSLRGHFKMDVLGKGQLFIEANRPPFILLRTATSYLILNDQNPARTKALYRDIYQQWSRIKPSPP